MYCYMVIIEVTIVTLLLFIYSTRLREVQSDIPFVQLSFLISRGSFRPETSCAHWDKI